MLTMENTSFSKSEGAFYFYMQKRTHENDKKKLICSFSVASAAVSATWQTAWRDHKLFLYKYNKHSYMKWIVSNSETISNPLI